MELGGLSADVDWVEAHRVVLVDFLDLLLVI